MFLFNFEIWIYFLIAIQSICFKCQFSIISNANISINKNYIFKCWNYIHTYLFIEGKLALIDTFHMNPHYLFYTHIGFCELKDFIYSKIIRLISWWYVKNWPLAWFLGEIDLWNTYFVYNRKCFGRAKYQRQIFVTIFLNGARTWYKIIK